MRFWLLGPIGLLLLLAVGAPSASAAQRYAAPNGIEKGACLQTEACSLRRAVEKAGNGDEVIVTAGEYAIPTRVEPGETVTGLYVHGDFGAAMPKVNGRLAISGEGGRLAYLELQDIGEGSTGIICSEGDLVERVRAMANGERAVGIKAYNGCTVRDSLALAHGKASAGLAAQSFGGSTVATVRNVTAIGSGPESLGLSAYSVEIQSAAEEGLDAKNVIASGDQSDLRAGSGGGRGYIRISNSNFDSKEIYEEAGEIDLGFGNQTAQPLFVNAPGGDYREAVGSPTIDAGAVDSQIGAVDLAGNPRTIGAAVDIGAYEFVPMSPAGGGGGGDGGGGGMLQALTIKPSSFEAANVGGAVISAAKKKQKSSIGGTVGFTLSAPAGADFSVVKLSPGRRAGKKCVKQTSANKGRAKCAIAKPVKGGFTQAGIAGLNEFKFAGRIGGKSLGPGSYELVGTAGGATREAKFTIVK